MQKEQERALANNTSPLLDMEWARLGNVQVVEWEKVMVHPDMAAERWNGIAMEQATTHDTLMEEQASTGDR